MSASLGKRLFTAPFWRLEPLLARILDELASGEPLRSRRVVVISHLVRDRLQADRAEVRPLPPATNAARREEEVQETRGQPPPYQSHRIPP